ncbi:MAG: RsmD family RNA methyltransferase, partial [Clostridia bacterium]|nr:RsmD family RNA methyltransferase [Clostridia bacterium]
MRVITGTARGTKLATLDSDATRPTSDKVKEAIFSMIQFDLEGRVVLDLFGGSGQLAIEALSRGAERAVIVDSSREATATIIENAKKTKLFEKCRVSTSDYASYLKGAAGREKFN